MRCCRNNNKKGKKIATAFSVNLFRPQSNSKYVDQSGHMESVFTPEGKVVVSIAKMGTFNFFGKANGKWAKGMKHAHVEADVKPYLNIFSRKCMKSNRLNIGLKVKEGINFLLPKKYKCRPSLMVKLRF